MDISTLFPLVLLLLSLSGLAVQVRSDTCSWCEAGDSECDWTFSDFALDVFPTSISSSVEGRGFPFYRPSSQTPFGSERSEAVTLAVVVQHGAGRNGEDYTSYVTNAVLRAGGSLETTLVIGAQVFEQGDAALDDSRMLWWADSTDDGIDPDGGASDWKWGGNSTSDLPASLSTFSIYDEMVLQLARRELLPNLKRIVFAGHSAGGQIMQRYALFSTLGAGGADHKQLPADLEISYFVANPSSTTYLGPERPLSASVEDRDCDFCVNSTIESQVWRFAIPSATDGSAAAQCLGSYNTYGYGLEGAMPVYPTSVGTAAAIAQYALRSVVYMSGASDICDKPFQTGHNCTTCSADDGGLDTSCEAYAQGWCRMARLHAFHQYVSRVVYRRPVHSLLSVQGVGHSGCGMFQSEEFAAAALQ